MSNLTQQADVLWLLAGFDIPVILSLIVAIIRHYKETEKRFNDHEKMCDLLRLELKLDVTALKAEAVHFKINKETTKED